MDVASECGDGVGYTPYGISWGFFNTPFLLVAKASEVGTWGVLSEAKIFSDSEMPAKQDYFGY